MHNTRIISQDVHYVGVNDRRITLFENTHPVTKGMAYNSFLITDEKTVLLDTVDKAGGLQFIENVIHALNGRLLDYLVINHMEPDHCGLIADIVRRYPQVIVVGNKTTFRLLHQFYEIDLGERILEVKEGQCLNIGKRTLRFFMAPMVHWPEVMVTYEEKEGMLFSADAFGVFGALEGNLFADQLDFTGEWLSEARRYYANIIGKYGTQTLSLLNKLGELPINFILPLHGPLWRKDTAWYIAKYRTWAAYAYEEKGLVIAVGSIYGNTEEAMDILAGYLSDLGVKNIRIHDVSAADPSYVISDIFRYSHFVLASSTYNFRIFPHMETLVNDLVASNIQNRTVAVIENGSWAPGADALIRGKLATLKNITIINPEKFTIKSSLKADQIDALHALAKCLADSM